MKKTMRMALVVSLAVGAWSEVRAEVRLETMFTDNMMLQRDQPVRVWGLAEPGETVKVSLAPSAGSTPPTSSGQASSPQAGSGQAQADTNGHWQVELPALKSGENLTLTVSGKNTLTCKNVIVGDIWLCGGQSNMELPLSSCLDAADDIKSAEFPKIRHLKIPVTASIFMEDHVGTEGGWTVCSTQTIGAMTGVGFYFAREVSQKTGVPIGLLNVNYGGTIIETWASLEGSFDQAAVASQKYRNGQYANNELPKYLDDMEKWIAMAWAALKDGRLVASAARATIKNWKLVFPDDQPKPPEGSVSTNGLADMEQWISDARAALKAKQFVNIEGKRLREPPVIAFISPKEPPFPAPPYIHGPPNGGSGWYGAGGCMFLYNGMIHPLVRFPVKGMLWYQGESNGLQRHDNSIYRSYSEKLRVFIADWRKRWGVGDFPFYIVQLTSFGEPNPDPAGDNGWAGICVEQLKTLAVTNTGMAVTIDIGDKKDIHPKNKYDVGIRLARWALARDYGQKDLVVSGPLYKGMKVEGDKIRLSFDYVGSGLMIGKKEGRAPTMEAKNGELQRFAIVGEDRKWVWATAVIDGNTVVVSSPEVKAPVAVRYAYSQNPEGANLYNREGLPASPFRTDNW